MQNTTTASSVFCCGFWAKIRGGMEAGFKKS